MGAPWPSAVDVDKATGLVAGARLTAVAGEPFDGTAQLDRAIATRFPGDQMTVTVSRGGEVRAVSWRLASGEAGQVGWMRWVFPGGRGCGEAVVVRDAVAWPLLGMMASFAHGLDLRQYTSGSIGKRVLRYFLALAWPTGMASFA